ncbi:MAG: bifunctional folylpolyglutamate synthase/dihydrofolate synthase [Magnetococcales bacterium]|nr:bifunctional folylpolyglutamate synthase/dihydrofolate synthase [Magnetococcales bacterium]
MSHTPELLALLERANRQSSQPIQLGLERVEAVLADWGNPHHALEVVHVAGTNGKGSVLAFLEAMLQQAGYRVGLYTSPHLQRVNERIRVDGRPIDDPALAALLAEALAVSEGRSITFFELLTVVAFCHFYRQGLGRGGAGRRGVVLLETGLGGRLDATNVVTPLVTVVTAIGMDHTEYLGDSLASIAAEKAGIFKKGVPAVAASAPPEVATVLLRRAEAVGAPLRLSSRDFAVLPTLSSSAALSGDGDSMDHWYYQEGGVCHPMPLPGLSGRHQWDNAALAIAAARCLQQTGWSLPWEAIQTGVRQARWPGRLERLPSSWGEAPTVLLDGAHNPAACMVLADYLLAVENRPHQPTVLVFAALQDKDSALMARILAPCVTQVWTTQVGGERGQSAEALACLWRALGRPAQACATPAEALTAACTACPATGQVLVCGSLYLVGAVRTVLQTTPLEGMVSDSVLC